MASGLSLLENSHMEILCEPACATCCRNGSSSEGVLLYVLPNAVEALN